MSRLLTINTYSDTEWRFIKIPVAFFWLASIRSANINHELVPYPVGIFTFINGSFLASAHTVMVFFVCAIVLALLYIFEKWMTATTFFMFALSLVLFTLEESSGIFNRHSLYTAIFLSQAFAYYRNKPALSEERIQFPVQLIAGGYFLAAISKIRQSGFGWFTEAPLASIQMIKGYSYAYFNTGDVKQFEKGMKHANFILEHKLLAQSLLAVSLFLELFAWVSLKNKTTAFIYGLLLTAMHIGIWYFMNILIGSIFYPMIIFMVNPLYLMYAGLQRLVGLLKP